MTYGPLDDSGMDPVWTYVDREIHRRRLKWAWLARAIEVSEQTANNWKRRRVPPEQYQAIAQALGITVDELLASGNSVADSRGEGVQQDASLSYAGAPKKPQRVPVVGTARMGPEGHYHELEHPTGHGDGFIEAHSADGGAYALRVKGDSMHPAIKHGQIVLVEPAGACVPGENVLVALRDGRRMIKELVAVREDSITVMSVNGGSRDTFDRREVEFVHSVAAVFSSSKWRPE